LAAWAILGGERFVDYDVTAQPSNDVITQPKPERRWRRKTILLSSLVVTGTDNSLYKAKGEIYEKKHFSKTFGAVPGSGFPGRIFSHGNGQGD